MAISPISGPPGTEVQVEVASFPADAVVEIGVGREDSDFDVVTGARTNANGALSTRVRIPAFAMPGERWVVVVAVTDGSGRSDLPLKLISNVFSVTPGDATRTYVVQPGDTLARIATRFDTTISPIVGANPGITNPNLIFPGQRLIIPS